MTLKYQRKMRKLWAMNLIKAIRKVFFVVFLLCLTSADSFSEVKFKSVEATGSGTSREEAINNALAEAISIVNGKSIQIQTIIKVMQGKITEEKQWNDSLKALDKESVSKINDASKFMKNAAPIKEQEFNREYVKEMIDKVNGGIKSYKIIKQKKKRNLHHITIKAEVAFFDFPQSSKRTRVAVIPFRIHTSNLDPEKINRIFVDSISNYLTQTRKFTVLDRTYTEEVAEEKKAIIEAKTPATELAKLGNEISADFLLLGTIEDLTTEVVEKKIRTSDRIIKRNLTHVNISYKLIDVTTRQVIFSKNFTTNIYSKDAKRIYKTLSSICSKEIGQNILFSMFPVLVEKIEDGKLYLGQGGSQFKKGERYEAFKLSDKIIDSYTGEDIGYIEKSLGYVRIDTVKDHYSIAVPEDPKSQFNSRFTFGKMIVRPISLAVSKEELFKKNKEKIKQRREEMDKEMEDDW
jgi:TolB-like protein